MRRLFWRSVVLAGVASSASLVACMGNVDLGILPSGNTDARPGFDDDSAPGTLIDSSAPAESGPCEDATTMEGRGCLVVGDAGPGDAGPATDASVDRDAGARSETGAPDVIVGPYSPLCVQNGSFETDASIPVVTLDSGFPMRMLPAPWQACANSVVDIDPYPWGYCMLPPANDVTGHYLGLHLPASTPMNPTATSISAPLPMSAPLVAGVQYAFSISAGIATRQQLAFLTALTVGNAASVVLTIYGGTSACTGDRLWTHQLNMANQDNWTTLSDVLSPTQNYSYLTIEATFLATLAPFQTSYVIIDDLTSPGPCK
jgi:hypothetical protein